MIKESGKQYLSFTHLYNMTCYLTLSSFFPKNINSPISLKNKYTQPQPLQAAICRQCPGHPVDQIDYMMLVYEEWIVHIWFDLILHLTPIHHHWWHMMTVNKHRVWKWLVQMVVPLRWAAQQLDACYMYQEHETGVSYCQMTRNSARVTSRNMFVGVT